jgi:hypothetical protein
MIKALVESIKIQACHFDLQSAIDKDFFYQALDGQGGLQTYACSFKELMALIDHDLGMQPTDYTTKLSYHTDLFFLWIRSACQHIVEIGRFRMHELFTLGQILEQGGDLSSATTGFWLERPDWKHSWKYITSKSTLRDIYTREGLLYTLSLVKDVWEPEWPHTETEDEFDPDQYALDAEELLPNSATDLNEFHHPGEIQEPSVNANAQADTDDHSPQEQYISCMAFIHDQDGPPDSDEDNDDEEQLAPSISHWVGPYNSWEVHTPLGAGFLRATIQGLRFCVLEFCLEDRLTKDLNRLEQLADKAQNETTWLNGRKDANRLVIYPHQWEFEHKVALTYVWASIKTAAELHCKELAEGRITEYMEKRGDSVLFSHGRVSGTPLERLMFRHPWRPNPRKQSQSGIEPKALISEHIKNLAPKDEVSTIDVSGVIECLFTSTHLIRKRTHKRILHCLLAALVTEAESMATSECLQQQESQACCLQQTIEAAARNIFFWIEGNTARGADRLVDPWHWPAVGAAWLASALKAYHELLRIHQTATFLNVGLSNRIKTSTLPPSPQTLTPSLKMSPKASSSGMVSLMGISEGQQHQDLRSDGFSYDLSSHIISMEHRSVKGPDVEQVVCWLWDVYHILEVDTLLSDPYFKRVLSHVVTADTGRDWAEKPGVFKTLIKTITSEIIEKEEQSLCCRLVGLSPEASVQTFDMNKWPGYEAIREALQLLELAAESRLNQLVSDEVPPYWIKRSGYKALREEFLTYLSKDQAPPGFYSTWIVHNTGKSELDLIMPFLISSRLSSTKQDVMESFSEKDEAGSFSEYMNWKGDLSASPPSSINHMATLATIAGDDKSESSLDIQEPCSLSQLQINQALMAKFRDSHPHFFSHPAYRYIQGKVIGLDSRCEQAKEMGVRFLPFFQDLVPEFQKYFNIFRTLNSPSYSHPKPLVWGPNTILTWDLIIKLFKDALAGIDCLVIVDKSNEIKMGSLERGMRHRIPAQVSSINHWREEHWPLSGLLEQGSLEKPNTVEELELVLSQLKQHETVLGYSGTPGLSTRFHTLAYPLQQLVYESKRRHWAPEQITAFLYITSQIREVLRADEIMEARMAADILNPASSYSPSTPPPDQQEASLLTFISYGLEMDTDDDNWGYQSDYESDSDQGNHSITLMSHIHSPKFKNMKEARRFPESYAPDAELSGLQQPCKRGHTQLSLPPSRPLSFNIQSGPAPPTEEEYLEQKALRARLRYLVQPKQDLTQCLGLVVNGQVHVNFRALLDDASNANLMTRDLADRLGIPILCSEQKLTTMTEKGMSVSGETPLLELVYSPTSSQPFSVFHKFVVVDPKNDLNGIYDILLGNSDSQAYRSTIDAVNDVFTIRPDFARYGVQSREISLPTEWQRPFKARRAASMRS